MNSISYPPRNSANAAFPTSKDTLNTALSSKIVDGKDSIVGINAAGVIISCTIEEVCKLPLNDEEHSVSHGNDSIDLDLSAGYNQTKECSSEHAKNTAKLSIFVEKDFSLSVASVEWMLY